LLYQLKAETDHIIISESALLLSLGPTHSDVFHNSSFLSIAVQSSRAGQAHLYNDQPHLSIADRYHRKRLWWCLVTRDRTIALGVRRPLQITPDMFDPNQDPLVERDMASEMLMSNVYDLETKQRLVRIFLSSCRLAAALTSTIMTVCAPDSDMISVSEKLKGPLTAQAIAHTCQRDLRVWFDGAQRQLSHPSQTDLHPSGSTRLYVDLQWISYL
jgi:hypothetical protein